MKSTVTTGLTDKNGRLLAVATAGPNDLGYKKTVENSSRLFEKIRSDGESSGALRSDNNKRGLFSALHCGLSFGGGQILPKTLDHSSRAQRLVDELLESIDVRRLAGFQSSLLPLYAPNMCGYIEEDLARLYRDNPSLKPNFPGTSYFPACTFNLGPIACTADHVDAMNVPWGWCAITALGIFDHKQGGHLVLYSLGVALELPPGSTVLIPSAIIRHVPGWRSSSLGQRR
ncbi:hypothetical protein CPB83DRAFT_900990 [Crepidotus variabilis]|uniref:Uncharacterized protein n=1 Tax=Crepidotus variabilis TaxID=179855 RepID=A0A9P6BC07_9AGAR|nr:hypothetical protein CPB83DRAFT_900990 [Crepidotus variabilis]